MAEVASQMAFSAQVLSVTMPHVVLTSASGYLDLCEYFLQLLMLQLSIILIIFLTFSNKSCVFIVPKIKNKRYSYSIYILRTVIILQMMVKLEVTKVLQTRGDDWALVKFRNSDTTGVCAGNFGCSCQQIVPGHVFNGKMSQKRSYDGTVQIRFKGKPLDNISHHFKSALQSQGVNWTCRDILFKTFKPIKKLFDVIEHKRWGQLTSLQKIGRKTVKNIECAYSNIKSIIQRSANLAQCFPSLSKYMSKLQLDAALKWMGVRLQIPEKKDSTEQEKLNEWVRFVQADPFRIVYHTEYDSFTFENEARAEFLKATKHVSRVKMAEAAAKDMHIMVMDRRRTRCQVIDYVKHHITKTGDYWMRKPAFLTKFHMIDPTWPIVQHDNFVTLNKFNDIEEFIAKEFEKVRHREQPRYKMPADDVQLDDTQRDAVRQACEHPLFVLQGGAGVGKTSVCRHIVESLYSDVTCAAPTGKAAQRLKESTGVEAYTVHRMYFARNFEPKMTLLLDEQSMQDLEILARVLQKYLFHKIIFVGDTGQLTSVGPGQFLKDLCASGVPQVELTHIYRSATTSYIATNGQKIRAGNTDLDQSPDSFEVKQYTKDEEIVADAVSILQETGSRPMVLCNTNHEIANLNILLRNQFNHPMSRVTSTPVNLEYISTSATFRYPHWRFAMGDSVINITNKYIVKPIDGTARTETNLQVANGDIGTINKISQTSIWVRFSDVVVEYEGPIDYSEYLRPAYALTVNKAQGSEYEYLIVKSVSSFGDKRERFYTAVTRAKKKCIVYEVGSANDDCIRATPACRKTFLFKK